MFIDAEELLPTPPPTPSPPMPSPSPPPSYEGKIIPLGHLRLSISGCGKLQDADRGDRWTDGRTLDRYIDPALHTVRTASTIAVGF